MRVTTRIVYILIGLATLYLAFGVSMVPGTFAPWIIALPFYLLGYVFIRRGIVGNSRRKP
jgi:flagellar biosynthesis protein FliP